MPTSFVDTSLLRVAYEVSGPTDGFPVILLHGWPDDARTWDPALPAFHRAGYRTYVPWLRGFGPTRFLRDDTYRSGQLVALGQDVVEFATRLGIGRHALVGHDWGARAAYIASALDEAQVAACIALSVGYGTNHPGQTLSYRQTQNYWYHWFMATARGERHVRDDRRAFTRHVWNEWFVAYKPDDAEFDRLQCRSKTRTGRRSRCTHIARAGVTPSSILSIRRSKRASIRCRSSTSRHSR